MCGRFTLISDLDLILHRFQIAYGADTQHEPRYNIAPSQSVLAVVNDGEANRLGPLRWGLIPHWAKDPKIGHKMINARAETLHEKASFRHPFRRQRCLILADSFYEWRRTDGKKVPIRIRLQSGEPFAFAGLWSRWISPEGEIIQTCSIITTEPNALMANIHTRMPVILHPEDEKMWLDRTLDDPNELRPLLTPYPAESMEAYEVSTLVNSPRNDDPACVEPV